MEFGRGQGKLSSLSLNTGLASLSDGLLAERGIRSLSELVASARQEP
ncbi:hypothetical protein A2U01_0027541 [Trifolium medium]|uniref:Uncharacterized protein n=1 Tax=Trifolium medium TaxID=97028 RepID=A0A392P352_9FABA|nr:hypothetical protein [Trifolium medium]